MKYKFLSNPLKSVIETNVSRINSKIILVRHAESIFNYEIKNLEKYKDNICEIEYLKLKNKIRFGHELLDCEITQTGVQQCYEAGKALKDYKVKYALVSPLKRCLMTLENILKISNHAPKIIVHPLIFEKIEDSCDILKDINRNMNQYSLYDWKLFKQIEHLPIYQLKYCDLVSNIYSINEEKTDKELIYYDMALNNFKNYNDYKHHKLLLEAMEILQKKNLYIESSKKTFERLTMFRHFLNLFLNNLKEDEKIIVVGHSIIFKHLCSKFVEESSLEPTKSEYILKNCELAGLSFN